MTPCPPPAEAGAAAGGQDAPRDFHGAERTRAVMKTAAMTVLEVATADHHETADEP